MCEASIGLIGGDGKGIGNRQGKWVWSKLDGRGRFYSILDTFGGIPCAKPPVQRPQEGPLKSVAEGWNSQDTGVFSVLPLNETPLGSIRFYSKSIKTSGSFLLFTC